jgi:hypothetical protein
MFLWWDAAHTQEYNIHAMKRVCGFETLLNKDDATKELYPAIQKVMAALVGPHRSE